MSWLYRSSIGGVTCILLRFLLKPFSQLYLESIFARLLINLLSCLMYRWQSCFLSGVRCVIMLVLVMRHTVILSHSCSMMVCWREMISQNASFVFSRWWIYLCTRLCSTLWHTQILILNHLGTCCYTLSSLRANHCSWWIISAITTATSHFIFLHWFICKACGYGSQGTYRIFHMY